MNNKSEQPNIQEFKFVYLLNGSLVKSDKYFMAYDLDSAIDMFQYVCNKRKLEVEVTGVKKWNRWSGRWEAFDASEYSARMNIEEFSPAPDEQIEEPKRFNFSDHSEVA